MPYIKSNNSGGYDFSNWAPFDPDGWEVVSKDDPRLEKVGFREETWLKKRCKSISEGGYGSWREQLEMIAENGIEAWQAHCQDVKTRNPKE